MSKVNTHLGSSFVFYESFIEAIDTLPDYESKGQVYERLCLYGLDRLSKEEAMEGISGHQKSILLVAIPNIAAAKKRYQRNVENGKKGGRPRKDNALSIRDPESYENLSEEDLIF